MKLAFITTINSLEQISSKGDIEFCLAPYALRYPKYKKYFIEAKKKGRYVIMDNGVAEGDLISNDIMVNLAIEMKVDEIIIPDEISNYEQTRKMRNDFLDKYYEKLAAHNIKILSVIQGKTIDEYLNNYLILLNDSRISVIGIPFRMKYKKIMGFSLEEERSINRIDFIANVSTAIWKKEIHCLGSNNLKELKILNELNLVRSCDSKLIARYGLNNMNININDDKKPEKKLFVTNKLTSKQIKLTLDNITKLREWLKN